MANEAASIAGECEKCAEHYEQKPGTVSHLTTCDLYRAIARLAKVVERLVNENDSLRAQING